MFFGRALPGTLFYVRPLINHTMPNAFTFSAICCAALLGVQCAPAPVQPRAAEQLPRLTPGTLPADFCYVDTVAPTVRADLKYAGNDNFVGRPIDGYEGTRLILRRDTAEALARAAAALAEEGYGLLVWDAYRPARAMRDFRAWSRTPDESTKAVFYPNITKQGIYDAHYIGNSSEHSWGVAVDLTLIHLSTGREVDMGGRHDLLDVSSATDSPLVSPAARANRQRLRKAMHAAGFHNYSKEWWHYRLANSRPWLQYNFPVRDDLLQAAPGRPAEQ